MGARIILCDPHRAVVNGPTRLYGEGGFYNFGELHATEAGLTVRIIDAAGRVRFETTLAPEL